MTKESEGQGVDDSAYLALLAGLPGVADQLRAPAGTAAGDPLDEVSPEELLALLAHLVRMREVTEDQQDRVLAACHRRGVSLRALATVVKLNSPEAVRKRVNKTRGREDDGLLAGS